MQKKDIYRLAWGMALEIWDNEKRHYDEFPNELSLMRLNKAKAQLREIETLLLREEQKEGTP